MGTTAYSRNAAAGRMPRSESRTSVAGSSGRSSRRQGYRGARYVATATAEKLSFDTDPSISVVPGAGRKAAPAGLPASVLSLAKLCAVALVIVAAVAVVRVGLTSAAAACALETRQITQDIEEARSAGNELEVRMSVLSNPSRIKSQAEAMGMVVPSPEYSDQITLPEDFVVTDSEGRLSLSGSLEALVSPQAVS